jgi:hypothetical protein
MRFQIPINVKKNEAIQLTSGRRETALDLDTLMTEPVLARFFFNAAVVYCAQQYTNQAKPNVAKQTTNNKKNVRVFQNQF